MNQNDINDASRRNFLGFAVGAAAAFALPTGAIAKAGIPGLSTKDSAEGLSLPPATEAITPFSVHVPQSAITDLHRRLAAVRWPYPQTVLDWSQGVPLNKAKELVSYWQNTYSWRSFERRLNAFPQYRTKIDGLGIHFIHAKSKYPNALPIILTHGWPGSIVEFLDVIPRLVDPVSYGGTPDDAFHVVVPSQPGFGFSDKPIETGWNVVRTAKAWGGVDGALGL